MIEQRITVRLQHYWDHLRGSDKLPKASAFHASDINHLWDYVFLMSADMRSDKPVITYQHIGMNFVNFYGMGLSDKGEHIYTHLVKTYKEAIPALAVEAAQAKKPTFKEEVYRPINSSFDICYRLGVYPLVDDAGNVTHLFGGMRWMSRHVKYEF